MRLRLALLGALASVPTITAQTSAVSFRNDVIPILTRAGCNAGSCHGAASGKNGFALSLFGYDPDADHRVLTRALRGRRVDPAQPEQSLMLVKATTGSVHQGGKRLDPDGPFYATLRAWIAAGAPDDGKTAPALRSIEIVPGDSVLIAPAADVAQQVRARYADGSERDVTTLALWSSSNDGSATVSSEGNVTAKSPGETCVLARFGGLAAAAQVMVLADDAPLAWPEHATALNLIDEAVHGKLRAARVAPADVCSDEVFVRRVYLDLLGMLPTPAETRAFLADGDAARRDALIDALLARPEFAANQAMGWAEVMQVDAATMEGKGASLFGQWLRDVFTEHRPLDAAVRELLTAEGNTFSAAPANFHVVANEPHLLAEKVAQNLLGVRMQCAQCHNHPFEKWSMDDYYGFAAFFGQVGRKRGDDPYEWVIWDRRNGEVRNKRDGEVSPPRLLGDGVVKIPADTDRRATLAKWLTAPENPFFAANVANRLWARLFGRGLVEPVDDVRVSNPASHPQLLQQLAKLFVDRGFDVRPVVAAICKSRTYQLARHPDAPPAALFAGNQVRRLSAEQLLDAIGAVTGVPTRYPGVALGEPATGLDGSGANVRFLEVFGRPARTSACTCDRKAEPTLGQTLHLINGDTIAQKIGDRNGHVRKALTAKLTPDAMLDELFLRAYSRLPSTTERERLLGTVAASPDKAAAWHDIYWAVLNSKEFTFQH